ncbi:hypothetical protein PWT90_02763 [Aphanocladium album]|nr:hypothetical protein PWT90_02763 [Aphanocladium album]
MKVSAADGFIRPAGYLQQRRAIHGDCETLPANVAAAPANTMAALPAATKELHSIAQDAVSVVCISDTHNIRPNVPDGDLLLHAGDLTVGGSYVELQAQLDWLNTLPHRYKVVIAGNHDLLLDPAFVARSPDRIYEGEGTSRGDLDWGAILYLNNTATTLTSCNGRSIKIYGSPWTPMFGNWAFQYPEARLVWPDSVPQDVDILLTHGPPKGHLDDQGKGCAQLMKEISRVRPKLVVFGHIHEARGREQVHYDQVQEAYDRIVDGEGGFWRCVCDDDNAGERSGSWADDGSC